MPAVQQTIESLFCIECNEVLGEGESSSLIHDECVDEVCFECEACASTFVDIDQTSNSRAIAIETDMPRCNQYYTEDGWHVCEDCVAYCDNCNLMYSSWEQAEDCCRSSDGVNCYSYRPLFRFHNDDGTVHNTMKPDTLYMGIELEMVRVASSADEFLEMAGEDPHDSPRFFYFKEDASVGYDGAELVTMPATLSAFEKNFPFDVLDHARAHWRVRAFEYESCGFHIHVNRRAFSTTHLWRFVRFQLKNPLLCQHVGQRETSNYATWQYDSLENNYIPDYVKGKRSNGRRYLAINFQNPNTVELRYFKGNILRNAIMKNVQFVHSMYEYTKEMSYAEVLDGALSQAAYLDWLGSLPQDQYAELRTYLTDYNGEN